MGRRKRKKRKKKHKKHKFKAQYAIAILLILTVGSALAAFIWISSVEEHVRREDIIIKSVDYHKDSGDLSIKLVNGLSSPLPIKSEGSAREQTVVTILPEASEESIDCNFVSLDQLSCEYKGEKENMVEPGEEATLECGGERSKCLLTGSASYNLNIFFGVENQASKDFTTLSI